VYYTEYAVCIKSRVYKRTRQEVKVNLGAPPRFAPTAAEIGHRCMKCVKCGFEAGRDVVAVLNIESRACEVSDSPVFPLGAFTPS